MAFSLFFGGVLNRVFLGIPYYVWAILAMTLFTLILFGGWYFLVWMKLKPYHGQFWATLKKTGASFVFDENMHFDFITDRSSKVIFSESFKDAQEAEDDRTQAPTATLGKVRCDFVFDPDKWTYPNSQQHQIIEDIAEKWNEIHPDDQIRTLVKFSRYMDEGRFDEHYAEELSHLKRSYLVPWSRIKMMYREREESGVFGFIMSLAAMIEKAENESMNKYAMVLLGFFGLLDLAIIVAHFLLTKAV